MCLAMVPIIAASSLYKASLYKRNSKSESESAEKTGKILIEVMNSIRTVVSLHKEKFFYLKFVKDSLKHFT